MGYNPVCVRDICEIFASIEDFRGRARPKLRSEGKKYIFVISRSRSKVKVKGQGQGHVTYLGQNRGLRPLIIFDRSRSSQGQRSRSRSKVIKYIFGISRSK